MQLEPEEKTISRSDIKQSSGKKPASRWRNKYWSPVTQFWSNAAPDGPGEFWGFSIHPSKDVAEANGTQAADRYIEDNRAIKYLGAFPIDGE
jgi:hypothetical protein